MTINVEALISSLGQSYQEISDAGLISYKAKPTGFSGDDNISLDMIKEGVYLSFNRNSRFLNEMTLRIKNSKKKDYVFPNKLPDFLRINMSRQWVHEKFGNPEISSPPKIIMKRQFGWKELYTIENFHIPISMILSYDLSECVELITFLPTSEANQ
ncbi:DUF6392 family protein [Xenorhabdus bovienii]|uniref:DUF6392 family protein n=1 Tax=Xenorhabdus bovienii TaxID=40576 RepID=UPI0023B2DBCD|nr:DUF6392 family protein [Xenorhabdus bovienii]MDE9542461.1 DUF6392 family protein [Xenorhabdus bovienii]